MKNVLKIFVLSLVAVLALGVAVEATREAYVPSVGIKTFGDIDDLYGKIGFDDNGNTFRCVYNATGTQEYNGQYGYYVWNSTDDYSVVTWEGTSSLEAFAGVWWSDMDGNSEIATSEYGWIQIGGIAQLWVNGDTPIAVGDVLAGTTSTEGQLGYPGNSYMIYLRPAASSETAGLSQALRTTMSPRATEAHSGDTEAQISVILRSSY